MNNLQMQDFNNTNTFKKKSSNTWPISIAIFILVIIMGLAYYYIFRDVAPAVVVKNISNNFPNLNQGRGDNFYEASTSTSQGGDQPSGEGDSSDLVQIWSGPILSYNKVYTKEKLLEVYFVEAVNGDVYKAASPLYEAKLVKKIDTKDISAAVIGSDSKSIAILKNGNLFVLDIGLPEAVGVGPSTLVASYVSQVYNNTFNNNFLYTRKLDGGLEVFVYNSGKKGSAKIGYIPVTNVSLKWAKPEEALVYTAASSYKQAILTMSLVTGRLLNYIENDGDNNVDSELGAHLYSIDTNLNYKKNGGVAALININTHASKCLIVTISSFFCGVPASMSSSNIDEWHLGGTRFADSIYFVDVDREYVQNIYNPSAEYGDSIDITDIRYDSDTKSLMFKNSFDDSLWALDTSYLY